MNQLIDPSIARQFDRLPPHSIEAEMAMLSSMMLGDEINHAEITGIVDREMLYQADHQIIYDVLCDLRRAGKPVDALILHAELERRQLLEEIGGSAYLGTVMGAMPSFHNGTEYARIVREKAMLRSLVAEGNDMLRRAYGASRFDVADEIVQEAIAKLSKLLMRGAAGGIHHIGEILQGVYEQIETGGTETVPFGFLGMDEITGGAALGEMIVIAARPSMGKSTLIKQIAVRNAINGVPVGIISLEEGRFKIGRNILASECRIDNNRIRKAKFLTREDWKALASGVATLSGLPLFVCDSARRMSDIRSMASIMAARHGVKMIIIDYLQRIRGVSGRDKYEQTSNISTELSDAFKECGVAGIAVAQLNRAVEGREDKRPIMSDLRDSGQIEQDADGIVFLHREDYYHLDDSEYQPTSIAELIIAKYRDGVRGRTVKLQSDLRYQRFNDLSQAEDIP